MSILLDVFIVLFILFVAWRGYRRGFVRTVVELAGYILAAVIAFTVSGMLAHSVYNAAVAPAVNSTVQNAVKGIAVSPVDPNAATKIYNQLPDFVKNVLSVKDKDSMIRNINAIIENNGSEVGSSAGSVARTATDQYAAPFFVTAVRYILCLLLFIILLFIVRIVARMVNRLFSVPVLGRINRFLGGILGIVKGILYAVILATGFTLLLHLFTGIGGITADTVGATTVFHLFVITL